MRHRDSPLLDTHNFDVAKRELDAVVEAHPEWDWPDETPYLANPYETHWAVGWVEWLGVYKDSPKELVEKAQEIVDRLDRYPILNEMEFCDLEYTKSQDTWSHLPLKERIKLCKESGGSIFSARRSYIPDWDEGRIFDYCRPD